VKVVVGNGMSATRLVEELVARGAGLDVTVVGDEPGPSYNRILLSAVLEGTHPEAETALQSDDALDPASRMPEFKVCAAAVTAPDRKWAETAVRAPRNVASPPTSAAEGAS